MLSGDNQETAERIAAKLPIDEVHGQMLPQDKAAFVKKERAKGTILLLLVMGSMIVRP